MNEQWLPYGTWLVPGQDCVEVTCRPVVNVGFVQLTTVKYGDVNFFLQLYILDLLYYKVYLQIKV